MTIDLLGPTFEDGMRDAARDADIQIAHAFGFGGQTWSVERPSGGGTGPRSLVPLPETVQALCYRRRPSVVAPVGGGTPVLNEQWQIIVISGDVLPDDVLTSTTEPQYRVHVQSLEGWYEYRRGEIEERR